MLHREPITLTLFDEADRTVTVEAVPAPRGQGWRCERTKGPFGRARCD